jgi:nitroreductase
MDFRTLASSRRSIRKYTPEDIDVQDIVECIKTAATAPSGCDSQCWKFVVVHNRTVMDKLADAVAAAVVRMAAELGIEDPAYVEAKKRGVTFFKNAPILVAVFMTNLEYYDKRMEEGYLRSGLTHEAVMRELSEPDVLSIGAAVQNFLLAVHEKGYGACWMNEPILAREAIGEILGAGAGEKLMSLIPIGRPAYTPKNKTYKPLEEIVTLIE